MTDFSALIEAGLSYQRYVSDGLPQEIAAVNGYREKLISTPLPPEQSSALAALQGSYTLIVAAEMWCPDCQRNVTAMQRLCELQPRIRMVIISKGRAEKGLLAPLALDRIAIPTVAVLDEQQQLIGQFIERPASVRRGDAGTLAAYKRGELLTDVTGDLLEIMQRAAG